MGSMSGMGIMGLWVANVAWVHKIFAWVRKNNVG